MFHWTGWSEGPPLPLRTHGACLQAMSLESVRKEEMLLLHQPFKYPLLNGNVLSRMWAIQSYDNSKMSNTLTIVRSMLRLRCIIRTGEFLPKASQGGIMPDQTTEPVH